MKYSIADLLWSTTLVAACLCIGLAIGRYQGYKMGWEQAPVSRPALKAKHERRIEPKRGPC